MFEKSPVKIVNQLIPVNRIIFSTKDSIKPVIAPNHIAKWQQGKPPNIFKNFTIFTVDFSNVCLYNKSEVIYYDETSIRYRVLQPRWENHSALAAAIPGQGGSKL